MSKRPKQPIEIETHTAPLAEWNYERGFGFLQHGSDRVFLHIRDLTHRRTPRVGDLMRFKLGLDARGRTCAVEATCHAEPRSFPFGALVLLPLFLALPFLAARRLIPNPWHQFGYFAGISLFTAIAYTIDKRNAEIRRWRIPELHLHAFELIGGWPAAFIAQRALRHKISKRSYQVTFWLILALHQYAAIDYLLHGKMTKAISHKIFQAVEHVVTE